MSDLIYIADKELDEGLKNGTTKFSGLHLYHRDCLYLQVNGLPYGLEVRKIRDNVRVPFDDKRHLDYLKRDREAKIE